MPEFLASIVNQIVAVLTATFVSLTGITIQSSPSVATISATIENSPPAVNTASETQTVKTVTTVTPTPTPIKQTININVVLPTATPTPTPMPTPIPKPTYACVNESETAVIYSTEPCPKITRKRKGVISGGCSESTYSQYSRAGGKIRYNFRQPGKYTMQIALAGKTLLQVQQSAESGEFTVPEDGTYQLTLKGEHENGYCSGWNIEVEYEDTN